MSSITASAKEFWQNFPQVLRKFCIRALLLIIIWKFAYHLYLKPNGTFDRPITAITVESTVWVLSIFYGQTVSSTPPVFMDNGMGRTTIYYRGNRSLRIGDGCNALELFILYAGFIICMPTNFRRMAVFIVLGIVGIFALNILRCSGMFWFNLHKKEWFDFAHHYAFKIIVYAAVFGAWVWYCRKINPNE
jgi:exosortase/archaeosortase family protein